MAEAIRKNFHCGPEVENLEPWVQIQAVVLQVPAESMDIG